MQFVAEEIPAFIKAKTHHQKAEELDAANEKYLERWRGFEYLYRDVAPRAQKEQQAIFAKDAKEVDVITVCLTQMSRPRVDALLRLEAIGSLNVALSKHNVNDLVRGNEMLQELELSPQDWLDARKDLRFALKTNTIKGLHAVAVYLLVVRASCDRKVEKGTSLVNDTKVLEPANALLKDMVTHLIEHFQKAKDRFFEPSFRANARRV
jgi:hypothetical protein